MTTVTASDAPLRHYLAGLDTLRQARQLWEACFSDDSVFVDFYFTYCAERDQTLIRYDEACKPIGHIGLPRYMIPIGRGEACPVQYISGACVLPEYRRGGIMREMIRQSMRDARAAAFGCVAQTLIPASDDLRRYYHRTAGFAPIGHRYEVDWSDAVLDTLMPLAPASTPAELLLAASSRATGLRHTLAQCERVLIEYTLYPHTIVQCVYDPEGRCAALCLARYEHQVLYIDYLLGDQESVSRLLTHFGESLCPERVRLRLSAWQAEVLRVEGEAQGMIRIVDLVALLEAWLRSHPTEEVDFCYEDSFLPELSGRYRRVGSRVLHDANDQTLPPIDHDTLVARYLPTSLDFRLLHE